MKDRNGTVIHIDDIVTLFEEVRPQRLIGLYAKVIAYGETRIKLAPTEHTTKSIKEVVSVDPGHVMIGIHKVYNPITDDPRQKAIVAKWGINYTSLVLESGYQQDVISLKQFNALQELSVEISESIINA